MLITITLGLQELTGSALDNWYLCYPKIDTLCIGGIEILNTPSVLKVEDLTETLK